MVRAALIIATLLGATAPALADERSLFYVPEDTDFRFQDIDRRPNEEKWPFAEDSGTLSCAWVLGDRMVTYFPRSNVDCQCDDPENPEAGESASLPYLSLSTDPIDLIVLNMAHRKQFAQTVPIEELIKRVAPYYAIGLKLCEQPQGTYLRRSEL
jgi:hypothetical protein